MPRSWSNLFSNSVSFTGSMSFLGPVLWRTFPTNSTTWSGWNFFIRCVYGTQTSNYYWHYVHSSLMESFSLTLITHHQSMHSLEPGSPPLSHAPPSFFRVCAEEGAGGAWFEARTCMSWPNMLATHSSTGWLVADDCWVYTHTELPVTIAVSLRRLLKGRMLS